GGARRGGKAEMSEEFWPLTISGPSRVLVAGLNPCGAITALRSAHGAPCCSVLLTNWPCLYSFDPPAISRMANVLLVPSVTSRILRTWLVTIAPWLPPVLVAASAITTGGGWGR